MLSARTRALLHRYVAADETESSHLARMQVLNDAEPMAFDPSHYTPGHFTASAFVVSPDSTRVLLILHAKLGLWLQPGGHVEATDADLGAAARREVLEETGLSSVELVLSEPLDLDVHLIPARKDKPAHEHFDVRFLFQAADERYEAQSDALAAKWVSLSDLDGLQTDESVLRAVRKIRRLLGNG